MVIYMKHAKHGTKVAISDDEARADEKAGWERYKLETEDVENALTPKRPGRPRKEVA